MEKRDRVRILAFVATLIVAACNSGNSATIPAATARVGAAAPVVPAWKAHHWAEQVCPDLGPQYARCMVLLESPDFEPNVGGWRPSDFQAAYNLPVSKGSGQTVAIVDAYDNPNAASDLSSYRTFFGLGKANFKKYNEFGYTSYFPSPNKGWGLEEDLDIEMVSAVCPKCSIDLVEANSSYATDLESAEETAAFLAHIVSNSWGCNVSTYCVEPTYFNAAYTLYVASAGDNGYGTQAPAALGEVVSVGGTVLSKAGGKYSETVWSGTGSGCASGYLKPSWQHDKDCSYRTMNDVSAVAQHVWVYDSYKYGGWQTVAGTSISTPLIAAVYALAGNASSQDAAKKLWSQTRKQYDADMHDVKTGSNGSCGGIYLCEAKPGYDGPTGWGTPKGVNAF